MQHASARASNVARAAFDAVHYITKYNLVLHFMIAIKSSNLKRIKCDPIIFLGQKHIKTPSIIFSYMMMYFFIGHVCDFAIELGESPKLIPLFAFLCVDYVCPPFHLPHDGRRI